MKLKLVKLEKLSKEETFYIIGGQVKPEKKKRREARKAKRKEKRVVRKASKAVNSDATDTAKNDSF